MTRVYRSLVAVVLLATGLLAASTASSSELYSTPVGPPVSTPRPPASEYRAPLREALRVDLDVLVDGRAVRVISHEGRLYLPVPQLGAEYEIRVSNRGSRRIEAVISVDGLSVVNGRPASERSMGYIVEAKGQVVFKGWRRDRDTVAAFTFTERENSYAARLGHRENLGVIGLMAFEEADVRTLPLEFAQPKTKNDTTASGGTGTGWGRDLDSRVIEVPFARSANKRSITIYYDTEQALRRLGVPVEGGYPKPFPADTDYCPPPSKR